MLRGTHKEVRKAVATNVLLACTTGGKGFLLLSNGMKRGSSILNLKPSCCGWNTTTLHFWRMNEFKCVLFEDKIPGYRLLKWERFLNFLPMGVTLKLYWNTKNSQCLPLSSSSYKQNFRSVAPPWQHLAPHKCPHQWDHHNIWMDSVAIPTLESWTWTIRFSPVWCFRKTWGHSDMDDKALQNSMHQWLQRKENSSYQAEIHAFLQRLRLYWNITHLSYKQHETENRGITFWWTYVLIHWKPKLHHANRECCYCCTCFLYEK